MNQLLYSYYMETKTKSWFQKIPSIKNLKKNPQQTIHLLKLVDKMCKYEMDPVSIVEEQTSFSLQTDRRTYGRTAKVKAV